MPASKDLPPLNWGFAHLFLHNQFRTKPVWPAKGTSLASKVALITGANIGLGLESARQLLDLQLSHLILGVRSTKKGDLAAAELRKKHPQAKIEVWDVDMASYDSIQAFVKRAQGLQRLDYAILNAGLASSTFRKVPSTGHEEVVQVNYLSTVLLATLLLPTLRDRSPPGEPGKLTLVNSGLAMLAAFKNRHAIPLLPSFDDVKNFDGTDTYSTSKTLAHLWLYKAADYIPSEDVVVTLVDPAYIRGTGLQRDASALMRPVIWLGGQVAGKTVQVGASTYVDAVVTKGKESHGSFLMSWEIAPFNDMLYTPEGKEIAERLWRETNKELEFANVLGVLEGMKKEGRS